MSILLQILFIGIAGLCGTVLRFGVNQITTALFGDYPWGTFAVNVVGCFLFGLLAAFFIHEKIPVQYKTVLLTGFLGGFTTFSAYAYELAGFLEQHRYFAALFHFGGQNVLGILAVCFGLFFGHRLM